MSRDMTLFECCWLMVIRSVLLMKKKDSACIVLLLVFWMEGCMGDLFRESGYYFAPTTIQVSLKAD